MSTAKDTAGASRKPQLDALLLKIPGVVGKKIGGLDAYFVNDRMFACLTETGIGIRLPVAAAQDLQFSRSDVVEFKPAGLPSSREWIQIDRAEAAEYEKDLPLFQQSIEFVKATRGR